MNLKKIIVLLLVIHTLFGIYFEVTEFYRPSWIRHLYFPDIFDFFDTLRRLLGILAYVLTFVGVFQIIQRKKIDLFRAFRYPIYYFIAQNIFWFITTLLSTKHSFFFLQEGSPWYYYILKAISLTLLILIFIHYLAGRKKEELSEIKTAGKSARFFNWVIDLTVIFTLGFTNLRRLSDNFVFENIDFLNSSASWFFLLNMFWYYLILELLFLQTIGKLHNNSFVHYEGSKLKAILTRTLCRFIPLEPFSFFGKEGWHDALSKTTVIIEEEKH